MAGYDRDNKKCQECDKKELCQKLMEVLKNPNDLHIKTVEDSNETSEHINHIVNSIVNALRRRIPRVDKHLNINSDNRSYIRFDVFDFKMAEINISSDSLSTEVLVNVDDVLIEDPQLKQEMENGFK
ncbi:MAG: hypothetical protein GY834_10605 [Bacteroidetes bacterium]|nr:hypothetical protein [Bacteroidota bacterium]